MVIAMNGPNAIAGPPGTRFREVLRVTETGSTNADVSAMAREGAGEGTVLVADHQTAGRGRAGRTWTAPPGASLLCTILLRPPASMASLVTTALAVSAAAAVEEVAGFSPGLKWPNDLLVGSKKLAGILAEAEWPPGSHIAGGYREPASYERATVAAGIGLNVQWPDEVPSDLADIAVACNHVAGRPIAVDDVLFALLRQLEVWYAPLLDSDPMALLAEYRRRSATIGSSVRVDLGADDLVGTAVDITDDGRLIVETLEGDRRTLAVGDVVHLRPRT